MMLGILIDDGFFFFIFTLLPLFLIAQVIGSLISGVQEACRAGLLDWSPRLMRAMYSCDIQASSE